MEWIQSVLDNGTTPVITAFLLGLLTAISPCPLATNITAIGYISKNIQSRHSIFRRGMLYTLGRIVAYAGLGIILIPLLRDGASIFEIQKTVGKYSEMAIAPALIVIGLFMLFGHRLNLPDIGIKGADKVNRSGGMGALLLGIMLSLAFCPTSGIFYFGMLMPLSAVESNGYALPVVYAVATGLPVILTAWVLAYSVDSLGKFYNRMQTFQKYMNLIIALLFIVVGIYYAIILWL